MKGESLTYTEEFIIEDGFSRINERNGRKSKIVDIYSSMNKVYGGIPYSIYYFSCNREHVFHDKIQVDDKDKMKLANDFVDEYIGREEAFVEFIKRPEIAVEGDYRSTWEFIKIEGNSLKRFSNFGVFFE